MHCELNARKNESTVIGDDLFPFTRIISIGDDEDDLLVTV